MVYEEDNKWKEYEKKNDYINAVKALCDEIATNLIRVHNVYSDKKYDPHKDRYVVYGTNFGKDSSDEVVKELLEYVSISLDVWCDKNSMLQMEKEVADNDYCKYLIKELKTHKNNLIIKMKNVR